MRVYALFHKSIYLFGLTLVLGLINPVITTVSDEFTVVRQSDA